MKTRVLTITKQNHDVDWEDYNIYDAQWITKVKQFCSHDSQKSLSLTSQNIAKQKVGGFVDKHNERWEKGYFTSLNYFTEYLCQLRKSKGLDGGFGENVDEEMFNKQKARIIRDIDKIINNTWEEFGKNIGQYDYDKCKMESFHEISHNKMNETDIKAFTILYLCSINTYWESLIQGKYGDIFYSTTNCEIFQKLQSFTDKYYVYEEKLFAS